MSLMIYRDINDIPDGIKIARCNDDYFTAHTELCDTELCRLILKEVEQAEYYSPLVFVSRNKDLGNLYREHLSTGTKTLINIITHKDVCFDLCECGPNALDMLPYFSEGIVLWSNPIHSFIGPKRDCDFCYKDRLFDNVVTFSNYVYHENDPSEEEERELDELWDLYGM